MASKRMIRPTDCAATPIDHTLVCLYSLTAHVVGKGRHVINLALYAPSSALLMAKAVQCVHTRGVCAALDWSMLCMHCTIIILCRHTPFEVFYGCTSSASSLPTLNCISWLQQEQTMWEFSQENDKVIIIDRITIIIANNIYITG